MRQTRWVQCKAARYLFGHWRITLSSLNRPALSETDAFTAPGLDPMTIEKARAEFWRLTPALLLVVYDAFGQTEGDAIYDTLASVTSGDALEYLYLERVGAMAGGRLEEADQTIHEIKLLNAQVARDGAALAVTIASLSAASTALAPDRARIVTVNYPLP